MNERHGREYWSQQVAEWRSSGLSSKAYSERHGLPYSSLCRWAGKSRQSSGPESQRLVELGQRGGGAEPGATIELVVGQRYVLRLRPSVRATDLREVLEALEGER